MTLIMTPGLRKFGLTAHVIASVGWLGAVLSFLVLAIVGLTSPDPEAVRSAYLAMEVMTRLIIVPLCVASLLTGIVQALGTPWGLFRHHWIVAKLFINVVSTILLLVHMRPITHLGHRAAAIVFASSDFRSVRLQVAIDAGAALVGLLVATLLAVYKPKGLTRYGQRKRVTA
jgi:hypothetical protein